MCGRELDGEVLSFGHAGILADNSFVMYDRKTGSLWVHVTGRAEWGPMKGKQLPLFPSTVTTWRQWKAAHPQTLVLPGYRRGGFMGTYQAFSRPDDLGLAVIVRFQGKLYPFSVLARSPMVNDRFDHTTLLIYYSSEEGTAVAWNRRLGGRELTFEESGSHGRAGTPFLRDRETGSLWSWLEGLAVDGRLKGAQLEPVSHHPILIDRFRAFYPTGPVFQK